MSRKSQLIFSLVLLLWSLPLSADELTIETMVKLALENDPILKKIDAEIHAVEVRSGEVYSHPPLQITYGLFLLPIETRNGPQRHKVGVRQSIPWPGLSSALGEVPEKEAGLIRPQKLNRIREIRYKVEQSAWTLWHHQRQLELTKAHLVLLKGMHSSAQSLNVLGRTSKSAVSRALIEHAKILDRLESEEIEVRIAQENLKRWTGAKIEGVVVERLSELPKRKERADNHPSLVALRAADQLDLAKIDANKKRDRPMFNLGMDYFEIGENENSDSGTDAMMATIGVSIPIWASASPSQIQSLKGKIVARSFLRDNIEREIDSKVAIETLRIEDAFRKIQYLEKTRLPLARVYRDDLNADFETDRAKISDVIQGLDGVYRLELELADNYAKFEKALSRQHFETGRGEQNEKTP